MTLDGDAANLATAGFNDLASSLKLLGRPQTPELSSVELAQTHVIGPEGRTLQSPNDAKNNRSRRLMLTADRAALLMVQPSAAVTALVVRAQLADGRTLGPLAMNPPEQLPASDGGAEPYSRAKYSALLPPEWVQPGATLEIGQEDFSSPRRIALNVTPATTLRQYTVPMYLFGARHDNSVVDFPLEKTATDGYSLDREYREKLPIAKLETGITAAVTLDKLAVPGRNDDKFCYPAMTVASWSDYRAIEGDTNARMLRLLHDLRGWTANRDGAFAAGYYGFVQTVDGGKQVAASTGGGLASVGGGVAASGGDYRPATIYSAIFNHEMGHAYGLPHADHAADLGDFPYPMGTKSGSSWGYDSVRHQLLTTREFSGQPCDHRTVDGVCYQRTPMSGGDDDRNAALYRWSAFSDYEAAVLQEGFLDKLFPDSSYDGGYKRWNRSTGGFEAMSDSDRARVGTDVLKTGQQVQTVIGTVSHFNVAPTASTMTVTPPWSGHLPRHIDPTVQGDLDTILSDKPGGWSGYYCLSNGCDYTLVATYADGKVVRVLLPIGYRGWNTANDTSGYKQGAQDPTSADNFASYAVNLPAGHGGLSRLQLFHTPHGSQWQTRFTALSTSDFGGRLPLVNEWTPADGATGGSGAPGTTRFDRSVCKPGATVKLPSR
ncbi:M66 family metalloprotease [Eleftheria terrae]|uniref:M66 family metalloprotease n=1 Tax=Eleftheria terrae TaxID=1597781 RepID=UPI00263B12BD|nr:M66 family metalloprotease [Eleftheria terrae]WKB55714.1 M66 family metalloprotease [Eleftheria terrae]